MGKMEVPDERVLDYLQVWKDRTELLNDSGIAWTTLYDKLARLHEKNLVKKEPRKANRTGRPRVFWKRCLGELEVD